MKRRNFLKTVAAGAMGATTSTLTLNKALAGEGEPDQFWVFVQAIGGWDVTSNWDPKGSEIDTFRGPMNRYSRDDIRTAGNISYAPVPPDVLTDDYLHTFTQKHYQRMMVLNGIDIGTNSHQVGDRVCIAGSSSPIIPTTPSIIAAPFADSQPMAYISEGPYSETGGYVAPSSLVRANRYVNLRDKDRYLGPRNESLLDQLKARRLNRLVSPDGSPDRVTSVPQLQMARDSTGELNEFVDRIPLSNSFRRAETAELVAAAFASNIAVSAQIGMGDFDSHSDNDQLQFSAMDDYLMLVDALWEELVLQGIADKTTIVLVSDLGRTPGYNAANGKDHWPTSSMVLMGANVEGNRVVGGTDDALSALLVDPLTLELSQEGVPLTAAAVHQAIRLRSGADNTVVNTRFPLEAVDFNLFV